MSEVSKEGKQFVAIEDFEPSGSKTSWTTNTIKVKAGEIYKITDDMPGHNGFRMEKNFQPPHSLFVGNEQVEPFGKIVGTYEEAKALSDEVYALQRGLRPQFVGTVTTSNFTGLSDGETTIWEIYFSSHCSRRIEVCFAGCNGAYFFGKLKEDGSTTLYPAELDAAVRKLLATVKIQN